MTIDETIRDNEHYKALILASAEHKELKPQQFEDYINQIVNSMAVNIQGAQHIWRMGVASKISALAKEDGVTVNHQKVEVERGNFSF